MKRGLSLVVPVHNAGSFILNSLREYYAFFSKKFKKMEIIVVCNACTDNTVKNCTLLQEDLPLKIINVPKRGKGYALTEGFLHAEYPIIGFLDADNPFNLERIFEMINGLEKYDAVIVTKFKKGDLKRQASFLRRIFSIGGATFSKLIFGLDYRDTQAGAKFMRKSVWDKINKPFICKGFEFDIELLYKMKKINANINEFFISPKSYDFSTVKLRILPGIVFRLIKLRLQA